MTPNTTWWRGTYEYSLEKFIEDPIQNRPVDFYIFLEIRQVDGCFQGYCYDLNGGNLSRAMIEGAIKQDIISFNKVYPVLHYFDFETGCERYLNIKNSSVNYEGKLAQKGCYEGEWKIDAALIEYGGSTINLEEDTGRFHMKLRF